MKALKFVRLHFFILAERRFFPNSCSESLAREAGVPPPPPRVASVIHRVRSLEMRGRGLKPKSLNPKA